MARYQEILLEDGTQVQLRLTTGKLEEYLNKVGAGDQNALLGVLDAMTLLPKRIKLFSAALQWPGNKNTIKDGATLLDRLLDEGLTARDISNMVLQLAAQAGLIEEEQLDELIQSAQKGDKRFFEIISSSMAGKEPEAANENAEGTENPTQTQAES